MRKSLLTTVLACVAFAVCTTSVQAQGDMSFGIKAGINLASQSGDGLDDASMKIGIAGGLFAVLPLSDNIGLQPELLFSQKGSEIETTFFGATTTITTNLSYIDVPIFLRYSGGDDEMAFYGLIGPNIGIFMSGTATVEIEGNEDEADVENIATLDLGLGLGAGVAFGPITVDLRYVLGLSNIRDEEEDVEAKNNVIGIMVGYRIQ